MKNILQTLLAMASLYGCLYILLGTITLIELFFNVR